MEARPLLGSSGPTLKQFTDQIRLSRLVLLVVLVVITTTFFLRIKVSDCCAYSPNTQAGSQGRISNFRPAGAA